MRLVVDDDAALKANTHPAERAARFSGYRAAAEIARERNRHGDDRSGRNDYGPAIDE
jgi:hypothetical protein